MRKINRHAFLGILFALAFSMPATGCGFSKVGDQDSASEEIFAMDTVMDITCYGDNAKEALQAAEDEINRLDRVLSVGNEDSEISQINQNKSGEVSEDTMEMIERALDVYETSDGAFDITIYPMMELWGFTTDDFRVPDQTEIDEVLKNVDSSQVKTDEETMEVSIGEDQGIDLGGIAKGFTSARLMEIFEEYELDSACVSLGGNVQCYKTKPDGSLWKCGIKNPHDPENTGNLLGVISIENMAVVTSGAYERYFTDDATGKTYHHILDPKTGYPADTGIISATIVSEDGTLADALSTTCYVMGLEKSIEYWKKYGDDFDMILMTDDDKVYVTEPISDQFSTQFECEVITK